MTEIDVRERLIVQLREETADLKKEISNEILENKDKLDSLDQEIELKNVEMRERERELEDQLAAAKVRIHIQKHKQDKLKEEIEQVNKALRRNKRHFLVM